MKAEDFEIVFKTYYKHLVNYVSTLANECDAHDIVVEVLIRVLISNKNIRDFGDIESIKGYLFIAVRNCCRNISDKKKVRDRHMIDYEQFSSSEPDIYDLYKEDFDRIKSSMKYISPKARRVFELPYEKGFSDREIARVLNTNPSTVINSRNYALKRIRNILSNNVGYVINHQLAS